MIIGLDLDGTVVDSPQQVVHYINKRLDLNLTIDDFKTYSMEDALPTQYRWIIDAAFRDPLMWKEVKLIDGAYETIKRIYENGHKIYFVTSSLPSNLKKKIGHLARNLDFFPADYVWQHTINIHHKQLLKLDVLVDDALFNLVGDRDYFSICMNMPYNQANDDEIPSFYRAYNWKEIYGFIEIIDHFKKLSRKKMPQ